MEIGLAPGAPAAVRVAVTDATGTIACAALPCLASYDLAQPLVLTASGTDPAVIPVGWSGCDSSAGLTCTLDTARQGAAPTLLLAAPPPPATPTPTPSGSAQSPAQLGTGSSSTLS
jgi:hypothetical protein